MLSDSDAQRKETVRMVKEYDKIRKEHDKIRKELDESMKETARQIKKVSKQLRDQGIGIENPAQELMEPSIARILRQQLGAQVSAGHTRWSVPGDSMETDMLGITNDGENSGAVYIVKIKRKFRKKHINQLLQKLKDFPRFYPPLANRPMYGVVAVVNISKHDRQIVMKKGIYLITRENDSFELQKLEGFRARCFNEPIWQARDVPYLRLV